MSELNGWHVERYFPLLRLQARQMQLNPRLKLICGDSSDLAQDALCRAIEKFEQFGGTTEGELVRWLQRILVNLVRDKMRKRKLEADLLQSLEQAMADSTVHMEKFLQDDEQSSPVDQAIRMERLLRLANALEKLPADQRDVIICRRIHGMPVRQIADLLGKTWKAVAMLQYHGFVGLRGLLDGS
jgi:RNA polymerase sigma-70 factor (ECF subfamily)